MNNLLAALTNRDIIINTFSKTTVKTSAHLCSKKISDGWLANIKSKI